MGQSRFAVISGLRAPPDIGHGDHSIHTSEAIRPVGASGGG
ncbi:hypothetical protein I552_3931 [Mycobacterium xenopi 3993]|nr:hypothetical protein I552_3931 [Mycobacterium xenopi 3993]